MMKNKKRREICEKSRDVTLREIELMELLIKKYAVKSAEKKKRIGKKPLEVGSFDINGIRTAERLTKWKSYIPKIKKKAWNLGNEVYKC
jgi:hypothetical protein